LAIRGLRWISAPSLDIGCGMAKGRTFRERVHEAARHVRFLTAAQAREIIDRRGATVIDVGEAWQLAERGTIPDARNISRGELDICADTELPRRDAALQDRTQTIILTCGGGGKATLCAGILDEMGFEDVWVIKGGCAAWSAAGYPLVVPGRSSASERGRE
jgi:rhodanese-related sulfurtransferase